MAFNLSERFSTARPSYKLLDPGSYQTTNSLTVKPNKVPFLSKCSRNTQSCAKVWTHAVYCGDIRPKIPNCTTISSKTPRFGRQNVKNEELPPSVCQCGIQNTCECTIEKEEIDHQNEIICHTAVRRRIFKGATLRPKLREEFSLPFRKDKQIELSTKDTEAKEKCPPFYDARVVESNAFYRGCKWSRWTSQRNNVTKSTSQTPGPADYNINEIRSCNEDFCAEKLRAFKRKTSKQLRFIEKIQRQHILEDLPGPANYSPVLPKGTPLKYIGPKAKRFILPENDMTPNPTTYFVKRDFDIYRSYFKPCLASLPSRAPFTVKALRFKDQREEGPSPASYNLSNISCQLKHCNIAPFGSCSKRFTDSSEKDIQNSDDNDILNDTVIKPDRVNHPTWMFRSKTIRMKPIIKMTNGPRSPELSLSRGSIKKRLLQFQNICPFFSSEARFRNWFNWISILGFEKTPGPAYYNLERRTCLPAVKSGPINRSDRFTSHIMQTPAPNAYEVKIGLDDILTTHNQRLKNNVKNRYKYHWKIPVEQRKLSLNEQEIILLNKSIALLEDLPDVFEYKKCENKERPPQLLQSKTKQPKLLRCFIYAKKVKQYY